MFTSEQLDALQAAAEAATPGPWKHSCYGEERGNGSQSGCNVRCSDDEVAGEIWHFDASFLVAWNPAVALEFVAAQRVLLSRIARVEALHQPDSVLSDYCEECSDFGTDSHPVGEFIEYPCPTVRALTEGEPSE